MQIKYSRLFPCLIMVGILSAPCVVVPTTQNCAQAQVANTWSEWQRVGGYPKLEYRYRPNGDPKSRANIASMEFRGEIYTTYKVVIVCSNLRSDGTVNPNHYESERTLSFLSRGTETTTAMYPVVIEVNAK